MRMLRFKLLPLLLPLLLLPFVVDGEKGRADWILGIDSIPRKKEPNWNSDCTGLQDFIKQFTHVLSKDGDRLAIFVVPPSSTNEMKIMKTFETPDVNANELENEVCQRHAAAASAGEAATDLADAFNKGFEKIKRDRQTRKWLPTIYVMLVLLKGTPGATQDCDDTYKNHGEMDVMACAEDYKNKQAVHVLVKSASSQTEMHSAAAVEITKAAKHLLDNCQQASNTTMCFFDDKRKCVRQIVYSPGETPKEMHKYCKQGGAEPFVCDKPVSECENNCREFGEEWTECNATCDGYHSRVPRANAKQELLKHCPDLNKKLTLACGEPCPRSSTVTVIQSPAQLWMPLAIACVAFVGAILTVTIIYFVCCTKKKREARALARRMRQSSMMPSSAGSVYGQSLRGGEGASSRMPPSNASTQGPPRWNLQPHMHKRAGR